MPRLHYYMIQLCVSAALLAWVPGNALKAACLCGWWALTFQAWTLSEWIFFLAINVFFVGMNAASLANGIFSFTQPDLFGQPCWEFLMWGFYLMNARCALRGPAPASTAPAWILAILFALCFSFIHHPLYLLACSGSVLAVALLIFREREDWHFAGYLALAGALIEYTGVWSGLWNYPGAPAGGVPFWFLTLWGGVGLFLRRLAFPLLDSRAQLHASPLPRTHQTQGETS